MGTSYNPDQYIGKMNSFGEVVMETVGKCHRDSKGNSIQAFKVRDAREKEEVCGYHVKELGQFRIDPSSDYGREVLRREKKLHDDYAIFRARQVAWVKHVEEILKKNGMVTKSSGSWGTVHVTKGWMKDIRRVLNEAGVMFELHGKIMSYDKKQVVFPVSVLFKREHGKKNS